MTYGKPVVYKTLITKVEVLFLVPLTMGRLNPIYKTFDLDNEQDALEWRLFRTREVIQAKIKYLQSRKITEEEFNKIENERKIMLQRVALKARELTSPKKLPKADEHHQTIFTPAIVVTAVEPENTFAVVPNQG